MRKIKIFMLVSVLAAVILSGCGSEKKDNNNNENNSEQSSEDSKENQDNDKVATSEEMSAEIKVDAGNMNPITADMIKDGTYSVEVDSSSAMFKITDCDLTVKDGKITAVMTMSGKGYLKVYMGTGNEAVNASDDEYITFKEDENGRHTFTVPVEALDKGVSCTAFSKNKEKWYDRTLVFRADSIPMDSFKEGVIKTSDSLKLEDGKYTVELSMTGGTGRAEVSSPVTLTVTEGKVIARIIWSSGNYDYVKINEQKYEPVSTEGNSVFDIPVEVFDWKIPIAADTVAMSEPHEIEYTFFFDSSTLEKVE